MMTNSISAHVNQVSSAEVFTEKKSIRPTPSVHYLTALDIHTVDYQ